MQLSSNALLVLQKRFLTKSKEGVIIEEPEDMFSRVARTISGAERDTSSAEYEDRFYKIMTNLEFLPNSPTLVNAGRELGMLSACFVLPIEDNMYSIFTTLRDAIMVQKCGGGTGFNFSNIRPKGDMVKSTQKCAGGPVSFIKIFDKSMEPISQGGVRRGANIAILNIEHPDILEFIHCKEDEEILQNFNISVGISDDFMSAVKNDRPFDLVNPKNGEIINTIKATKLFADITQHAWQNGEPGVIFLDEINRHNVTPHKGNIEATNPCAEEPLLAYESCNLGSLNLGRFVKAKQIDWDRLQYVTQLAVRFLDNVIDMNKYPISQIETQTKMTRKIGLGVMGFADMLIKLDISYNTDEAVKKAGEVMKFIYTHAQNTSIELAKTRGVFPAYKGSIWHTEHGIRLRNACLTAIAPTGTLSIIANCSSGIEPYYSKSTKKHVLETILEEEVEFAKEDSFITSHEITPEWHIRMQAAFQQHTDGAVSKTINFPESATIEDVGHAYMLAFKLKCKGLTIYRDKSRQKQVLTTEDATQAQKELNGMVNAYVNEDVCPQCRKPVIHTEGCVKCTECTWSACKL